jgi:hypothetical protein
MITPLMSPLMSPLRAPHVGIQEHRESSDDDDFPSRRSFSEADDLNAAKQGDQARERFNRTARPIIPNSLKLPQQKRLITWPSTARQTPTIPRNQLRPPSHKTPLSARPASANTHRASRPPPQPPDRCSPQLVFRAKGVLSPGPQSRKLTGKSNFTGSSARPASAQTSKIIDSFGGPYR